MVTVFTPTYNRAYTLPRLYESLVHQNNHNFEWLIIDDGSTDNTEEIVSIWLSEKSFPIRYFKKKNGGKQRAINDALQLARGELFFIVDSDDCLTFDSIDFIISETKRLPLTDNLIGISQKKGNLDGSPLCQTQNINHDLGYVEVSNLERKKYGLEADMAEVFITKKLREYSFPVWPGETFTPEAVVWDRIALDGYKIRWYDRVGYLCEYQPDGLTNSSWRLLKNNPMGYAMLFNIKILSCSVPSRLRNFILQFLSCCFIAKEYKYIAKCNSPLWAILLLPLGWLLSIRRRIQFKKYV